MQSADPLPQHHLLRAEFAKILCVLTLGLIFLGGVVTSNNAGLAVPDWPTSFGYQMWAMPFSMWQGGVLYEHSHRVLASLLGFVVMAMAIWLMVAESRRRVRVLGLACLAIVIIQGILGGVGVLLSLPVVVSVAHGVLAQSFFCLTIMLAYALSRERVERLAAAAPATPDRAFRRATVAVVALVFAQLILAAWMRHDLKFQGGVAIPDFPKTAGRWLPWVNGDSVAWVNAWRMDAVREHQAPFDIYTPVRLPQLALHLAHRAMALVLVVAFAGLTIAVRRRTALHARVRHTVYALDALLLLQVALGILVIWSNRGPLITSLHVVTGAATLGTAVLLALRASCPAWSETPPRAAPTPGHGATLRPGEEVPA